MRFNLTRMYSSLDTCDITSELLNRNKHFAILLLAGSSNLNTAYICTSHAEDPEEFFCWLGSESLEMMSGPLETSSTFRFCPPMTSSVKFVSLLVS